MPLLNSPWIFSAILKSPTISLLSTGSISLLADVKDNNPSVGINDTANDKQFVASSLLTTKLKEYTLLSS